MSIERRTVTPESWLDEVDRARTEGHTYFDWMDCVDEIGRPPGQPELRVLVQLLDRAGGGVRLEVRLPRHEPSLATLSDRFGGAGWAERELHDLFGVEFVGGDDTWLLVPDRHGARPLLKDQVLGARVATTWPGAKEPGEGTTPGDRGHGAAAPGRRRMVPPGVPDPQVWGDRDPNTPPATAEEIAASVQGGRVRRRR